MLSHPRIPAWRTPQPRACATALRSAVAPPRQCLTILEVFQLPASITQVVDAPGAGGLGLGCEPNPIICAESGTTPSPGSGLVAP